MELAHHIKKHVKRHWATKKGRVGIIFLLALFVAATYSIVSFLFVFTKSSKADYLTDAAEVSTNMHRLRGDEFALVTKNNGKSSGKTVRQAVTFSSGQVYTFDVDQNTITSVIEGSDKVTNYVSLSPDVTIHKKDEIGTQSVQSSKKQKIDPAISKNLKNTSDTAPVIIRLNVPYGLFYEKGQNTAKATDKLAKFQTVRDRVIGKFSSNSKKKRDLTIISSIAADIDQQTLDTLASNADVQEVDLDGKVNAVLDTSLDQIQAKDVWNEVGPSGQPLTGIGERIAIIDTGVDYTHPDLGGCLGISCKVIGGYDFINNDTDPMDDMGHGTHVAATAAGKGLLNGVAPDAKILAVKVLDAYGSGLWSQVIAGIQYAADPNGDGDTSDHADVASMSLGGNGNPDDPVSTAVDNATSIGVVFAIAAGNSGPMTNTIQSPGAARSAIAVAASCKTAQIGTNNYCNSAIASFSSRGPLIWNGIDLQKPDVAAPGVLICAARWGSSFPTASNCFDSAHIRISGTSMATPHVAGVAALIREAYPQYAPAQVKQLLRSTARNLGMTANDQGAGEVNAKAAIPISQALNISPNVWTFVSSPSKKVSTNTQTFAVTPTDSTIATLAPQYTDTIPGLSVSFSKTTLQVAGVATDSFDATVSIDNDIAKVGTYMTHINLVENGTVKGIITLFITIKPTFTISPQNNVDYGVDAPNLSSWTSNTQAFTITNLRTDISQTLKVASSIFASGITFNTPTSVTVPASSAATINTQFSVDNTKIANNIYTGTVTITNTNSVVTVETKFTKFFVLIVQDANSTDLAHTFPVAVRSSNGTVYTNFYATSPKTFYLNDAGIYDVIARYYYPPSKYADSIVTKEGITVTSGTTTVDVSVSSATNMVQVTPVDSSGQPGQVMGEDFQFVYQQQSIFETFGGTTYPFYMSNMSSNYGPKLVLLGNQPSINPHFYYYSFLGLLGNKTLTNVSGDFKKMNVQWNLPQLSGAFLPVIFIGNGSSGESFYYNNQTLPLPLTQTIYTLAPSNYYFSALHSYDGTALNGELSFLFPIDGSLSRMNHWGPFYGYPFPPMKEPTVYNGLGPSVWMGQFYNSKIVINIGNEVWRTLVSTYLGGDIPGFLRQDYTTTPYGEQPFTIYQGTTLYYSGVLPSWGVGAYTRLQGVTLPKTGGVYTFKTNLPYADHGQNMTGNVVATFDTTNIDPNPPAFKRLYYYANGQRSEVYDPSVENKVEFELDPVGGSISTVSVGFSTDGITFQPVAVTNSGSVYTVVLPQTSGTKATIMIKAVDSANNMMSYTFELPYGTAPVAPSPTPTPTSAPLATPTPTTTVPTATPTPVPATPTPNPIPAIAFASVQATNITASQALITWNTVSPTSNTASIPGTTQVKYGLTKTSMTQSSSFNATPQSFHTVTLTGLVPRTTYFYQVLSNNSWGYPYASSIFSFKTKPK